MFPFLRAHGACTYCTIHSVKKKEGFSGKLTFFLRSFLHVPRKKAAIKAAFFLEQKRRKTQKFGKGLDNLTYAL
jgi:hypothetical protein